MNWFQILQVVVAALPAVEALSAEAVQLIAALSHAASQAPADHQASLVAAAAKFKPV